MPRCLDQADGIIPGLPFLLSPEALKRLGCEISLFSLHTSAVSRSKRSPMHLTYPGFLSCCTALYLFPCCPAPASFCTIYGAVPLIAPRSVLDASTSDQFKRCYHRADDDLRNYLAQSPSGRLIFSLRAYFWLPPPFGDALRCHPRLLPAKAPPTPPAKA